MITGKMKSNLTKGKNNMRYEEKAALQDSNKARMYEEKKKKLNIIMKEYKVKIPMCLVGVVKAKDKSEAIEIATESFSIDNTPCEWWDIVETEVNEIKEINE